MAKDKEREHIISAYPDSKAWKEKVLRMTDSQVVAVYMRLRAQGKIKL